MSFLPHFSHIYVEKEAFGYEPAVTILERFKNSSIIEISHYKDVFNRKNQNLELQKQSKKLILAIKRPPFIYPVSELIQTYSQKPHYYAPIMQNCIYDCDYCVLQGMYRNANLVFFINIEEYFDEAKKLDNKEPCYLSISYDTDLLGFEGIYPITAKWLEFSSSLQNTEIEIRTKSANFGKLKNIEPIQNGIFSWTLLPQAIVDRYEHTTKITSRINDIIEAISRGWRVRLCFDPLIWCEDFEEVCGAFFDEVFSKIPPNSIEGVVLGSFRMSSNYLKNIKDAGSLSPLIYYPFETKDKISSYPQNIEEQMIGFAKDKLAFAGVKNIYERPKSTRL